MVAAFVQPVDKNHSDRDLRGPSRRRFSPRTPAFHTATVKASERSGRTRQSGLASNNEVKVAVWSLPHRVRSTEPPHTFPREEGRGEEEKQQAQKVAVCWSAYLRPFLALFLGTCPSCLQPPAVTTPECTVHVQASRNACYDECTHTAWTATAQGARAVGTKECTGPLTGFFLFFSLQPPPTRVPLSAPLLPVHMYYLIHFSASSPGTRRSMPLPHRMQTSPSEDHMEIENVSHGWRFLSTRRGRKDPSF